MNDNFNKTFWEMAHTSPDIQQAILKCLYTQSDSAPKNTGRTSSSNAGYYSIPTIDKELIKKLDSIEKSSPNKVVIVSCMDEVRNTTIGDLEQMLDELRPTLASRESLSPHEKTLRDIDIVTLALFAIVNWADNMNPTDGASETQ